MTLSTRDHLELRERACEKASVRVVAHADGELFDAL